MAAMHACVHLWTPTESGHGWPAPVPWDVPCVWMMRTRDADSRANAVSCAGAEGTNLLGGPGDEVLHEEVDLLHDEQVLFADDADATVE